MDSKKNKKINLIICGYSRCGTTYLYNVLKSTQKFAVNSRKELRYFIDDNYLLNKFSDSTIPYNSLFNFSSNDFSLDSSPDYIHNQKFVNEYKNNLNLKAILVTRHLDQRLNSWWRYSIKKKLLKKCSFENFKKSQLSFDNFNDPAPLSIISNMKFRDFKNDLLKIDSNRLLIINFDDLKNNPKIVLDSISSFLGLKFLKYNLIQNQNSSEGISFYNKFPLFVKLKNFFKKKIIK